MTDDNELSRSGRIDRRKFLGGVGAGVAAGLAGCSGGGQDQEGQNQTTTTAGGTEAGTTETGTTETGTTEATAKSPPKGGKPILGMATAPNNLNPLASSTAYTFTIIDNIYTYGTLAHPDDSKPIPWGFKDWTLNVDNIGTSKPAIVAKMRDGLTFSDGKKVTAEDYKFTVEYIKEQEPAGSISASQFSAVESVEVDKPKGNTVNFFLKNKDNAWLTSIIGNIFLPKHRWKNVSDYSKYTPRKEGGPIGSGPFKLTDYSWENWFEVKKRSDDAIPWNGLDYTEWLHNKGPFVDSVRFEVFGSQTALNQNLLDGKIDQTYGSVKVEKAAKAKQKDYLEIKQAEDDGWSHHSYNTRRVPLDDPAFRQLLNKMLDEKWVIESLYKGIGAEYGDYGTPKAYGSWRPPEPSKIKGGEYEGIRVPDLVFPGKGRGSFQLDQAAVDEARKFLVDNPDAKHDYSIGQAKSDKVKSPDGKAIYVNGKPIGQAHTNNNGEPGLGPLEMSYNPPKKSPKSAQLASQWVSALRKIGIPVSEAVESFNSQLPKIYANENFDMFEMGWTGIGWNNDHYKSLYSSKGADLKGNKKAQKFNPMGYTGADDLIFKQSKMMEPKPRQPIVKKVLAQIYQDAPTLIKNYSNVLQPVTTGYTGRVKAVGGVTNSYTWMNIRKNPEK